MPIFISYSHADKKFVDRLAMALVRQEVHVWLDRWELRLGDSLITKIQEAITEASGLLVVLSGASVKSEWCRKELNSGLMRELDEKRVVVLPILVEDCTVPLFLRDKMYADFRTNFDDGLFTVLEKIASVTNEWQARIEDPEYHNDMAIDWGCEQGTYWFRVTAISHGEKIPYSILSTIMIYTNVTSSIWYHMHRKDGSDDIARAEIIGGLAARLRDDDDTDVILTDQFAQRRQAEFDVGLDGDSATRSRYWRRRVLPNSPTDQWLRR
ncbi:MAG: hypothetical protein JWP89_3206 [Schlesneria sp.]|nr:hypothetical protein [Schlesneria sp.]